MGELKLDSIQTDGEESSTDERVMIITSDSQSLCILVWYYKIR